MFCLLMPPGWIFIFSNEMPAWLHGVKLPDNLDYPDRSGDYPR